MTKVDIEVLIVVFINLRYLGNNCTNMAVVELEMPTGYRACESEYRENPLCLRDVRHSSVCKFMSCLFWCCRYCWLKGKA